MLYNYREVIKKFGSDYKIKKAIMNKEIYIIESGIYSDRKDNYTLYELILKKYNKAFLVKNSALHFIGFTNNEPELIHIGTTRNALRIKDKRVKQHFYSNMDKNIVENRYGSEINHILCYDNVQRYFTGNQNEIRLWNLQALLFDLIRDSKFYSKEELLEILMKFRDCSVFTKFDYFDFEDNFYNENLPYNKEVHKLIREIDADVMYRKFRKEWDWD